MSRTKAKKELEGMVALYNEKAFDPQEELRLKVSPRPDLGGVLVFLVVCQKKGAFIGRDTVVMPIPPVTICWGGGADADAACEIALKKLEEGSDLIGRYLPFTAGSLAELEMKAVAYYG